MTNKLGSSNPNRIPKKTIQDKARKILNKSYADKKLKKDKKNNPSNKEHS
tara:strand:- start:16677 stop:16826 length:150 start_codon:yes stop_codon:yes gene_type:complete